MIKDNKIKINGIEIPNVREIFVTVETPADKRGIYREPTIAATVTIVRDASFNALVDLFDLATNEDGRKNVIKSCTLDFHSNDYQDTYSYEISKAFISSWVLDNPEETNGITTETIVLKAGGFEFKAGGGSAKFELPDFN